MLAMKLENILRAVSACRLSTYRHRFARAAPAPRAKRNDAKIQRIVDVRRPSSKRQTAYPPVKSFDSFLKKTVVCSCSELKLSANMFYRAMIYFHFGA